ncbi:hypothetical protein EPN90_00590 [Patescibacteria group bacterium]|nr:MAG: hypothetical protein EPN90_00590 [Patescibacteria group bacterium]
MSKIIFQNRREIHEWLWHKFQYLLDEHKRAAVEEAIAGLLDNGEVTRDEVDYTLVRELRVLRDRHQITAFEYEKIIAALRARETET